MTDEPCEPARTPPPLVGESDMIRDAIQLVDGLTGSPYKPKPPMPIRPIPALPDRPNEWAVVNSRYGWFMQRWMPGAFGDLETLEGVERYRVIRENIVECPESSPENPLGLPERTIIEAEVRA